MSFKFSQEAPDRQVLLPSQLPVYFWGNCILRCLGFFVFFPPFVKVLSAQAAYRRLPLPQVLATPHRPGDNSSALRFLGFWRTYQMFLSYYTGEPGNGASASILPPPGCKEV